MPFVPPDMNPHEKTLLASITAQTIARRGATTPQEVQAARATAQQVAGEMIWAERGESMPAEEEEPMGEYLTAYYQRLATYAADNQITFEDDEPYSTELPEHKPND